MLQETNNRQIDPGISDGYRDIESPKQPLGLPRVTFDGQKPDSLSFSRLLADTDCGGATPALQRQSGQRTLLMDSLGVQRQPSIK